MGEHGEVKGSMENNVIQFGDRAVLKKDIDTIQRQVKERTAAEAGKFGSGDDGGDDVSSNFVRDCFRMNELGDGLLFRELHRGKFVFNKAMDSWMVWNGHYWDVDSMDLAKSSVENVVAKYIREAVRVSAQICELNGKDEDKERSLKSLRDVFTAGCLRCGPPGGGIIAWVFPTRVMIRWRSTEMRLTVSHGCWPAKMVSSI